jgi:hypothetical protein
MLVSGQLTAGRPVAQVGWALQCVLRGRPDEVLQLLDAALPSLGTSLLARLFVAACSLAAGLFQAVGEETRRALELVPGKQVEHGVDLIGCASLCFNNL